MLCRLGCGLLMTVLLGTAAAGQVLVVRPGEGKPPPPVPRTEEEEPQVMEVSPAAEPIPALRIRFWPPAEKRLRGDAMVQVQRALLLNAELPDRAERDREFAERYSDWISADLADLPREEIRAYLDHVQPVLEELRDLPHGEPTVPDPRFEAMSGTKLFTLVLPEIQGMRQLARLLQLEARLALAEGRQEDALRNLQNGLRLGEVAGSATPVIIGRLVGIAITGIILEELRLAMTLPDAPNYYWALATIPNSVWDMRESVAFELGIMPRVFDKLRTLPDEKHDASTWRERLLEWIDEFQQMASEGSTSRPSDEERARRAFLRLGAGAMMVMMDGAAREALRSDGVDPSDMTPSEAIARATLRDMEKVRDEQLKWLLLPASLGHEQIRELSEPFDLLDYREEGPVPFPPARAMSMVMSPSIRAASDAERRGLQTVAVLATVEALRMHAARHGEFPEQLDQLDPVPAWPDPVVNGPFAYERVSPQRVILQRSPTSTGWRLPHLILQLREN